MAYGVPWDAVFAELVDEFAGQNIVEKLIHFCDEASVRGYFPSGAPEDRKNLNGGEGRTMAISEMSRSSGRNGCCCGAMQRNDADRMLLRARYFFAARL